MSPATQPVVCKTPVRIHTHNNIFKCSILVATNSHQRSLRRDVFGQQTLEVWAQRLKIEFSDGICRGNMSRALSKDIRFYQQTSVQVVSIARLVCFRSQNVIPSGTHTCFCPLSSTSFEAPCNPTRSVKLHSPESLRHTTELEFLRQFAWTAVDLPAVTH